MKNTLLLLIILVLAAFSCKNAQKNTIAETPVVETERVIITIDSITPGVKYTSAKVVDPSRPITVLDYTKESYPSIDLDISKYAESVEYVRLRHPEADSSKCFFYNNTLHVTYERGSSTSWLSASISFTDNGYIVRDILVGLFYYDLNGAFLDCIYKNDVPYKYEKDYDGDTVVEVKNSDRIGYIGGGNSTGKEVLFVTIDTVGAYRSYWYDLDLRKITMERVYGENERIFSPRVINDTLFYSTYTPVLMDDPVSLVTFGRKGEMLSVFRDYTHEKYQPTGNRNSPEAPFAYIFDGKLNTRAPYNDTLYVLESPERLTAKYVINLGERRVDPKTGIKGDKSNKLLPKNWMEAKKFITFTYTLNIDVPINRDNNRVKYFFTLFDKSSGEIYHIPTGNAKYPDEFILSNKLSGGMPFYYSDLYYDNSKGVFYVIYDKNSIRALLNDKNISAIPANQRANLEKEYNSLVDGELLLMMMREK